MTYLFKVGQEPFEDFMLLFVGGAEIVKAKIGALLNPLNDGKVEIPSHAGFLMENTSDKNDFEIFEFGEGYTRRKRDSKRKEKFCWEAISGKDDFGNGMVVGKTHTTPDQLEAIIKSSHEFDSFAHWNIIKHNCQHFVQFCLKHVNANYFYHNYIFRYLRWPRNDWVHNVESAIKLDVNGDTNSWTIIDQILAQAGREFRINPSGVGDESYGGGRVVYYKSKKIGVVAFHHPSKRHYAIAACERGFEMSPVKTSGWAVVFVRRVDKPPKKKGFFETVGEVVEDAKNAGKAVVTGVSQDVISVGKELSNMGDVGVGKALENAKSAVEKGKLTKMRAMEVARNPPKPIDCLYLVCAVEDSKVADWVSK